MCRSGVEELVEPVFEVIFAVEGNIPHLVRHGAEKVIIRWRKVWRVRGVLKNFPFELLEGGFDDLSNMRPDVVIEQDDLALSIRSFQSKSLIHAAQLQDV